MGILWAELYALGSMYGALATRFVWAFLAAILIAAILTTYRLDRRIVPFFERAGLWGYVGALLLGLVSPFWALGVLPAVAGLLASGTPLTPVMVFLATSPLLSPTIFLITLGGLGWNFALGTLLSAIFVGSIVGLGTAAFLNIGWLRNQVQPGIHKHLGSSSVSTWSVTPIFRRGIEFVQLCGRTALYIGKFIALALLLEVVLLRYLPVSWIQSALGASNPFSVPIATTVGLPAYLNSSAAVPMLSGLLDMGMDRGAALAFLVAGPIASVPSIVGALALVRWGAISLMLVAGFTGAVVSGYTFTMLSF